MLKQNIPLRHIDLGLVKRFAVISDVHLRDPHDSTTSLFVASLAKLSGYNAVFFLGDIFDFIFAGQRFFVSHWKRVFDAFEELRASGCQVVFLEGNHDFGFEHHFPRELASCFSHAGDIEAALNHPKLGRVVLRHGDDIVCQDSYRAFRKLVKSKSFQDVFGNVPGAMMHKVFSKYAQFSRRNDEYRPLESKFLRECIMSYLMTFPPTRLPHVVIIGHIHQYVDGLVEQARLLSGPDWVTAPSVLTCGADGVMEREFFSSHVPDLLQLS